MGDEIRRPAVNVSFTRWSLAYNAIFAVNLVTTPFMAYLIEPYPGQVISNQWEQAASFEEYTSKACSYFQQIYNNETMDPHTTCQRDLTTNTFAMRRSMTFPFESPQDDVFGYMIEMPASLFYGTGMRSFVLSFLTANETTRSQKGKPWQFCQHQCLFGMHTMQLCIWIDKIKETTVNLTEYMVYAAIVINEPSTSIWLKFIYRCTVSIYVCYGLWTNYYAHYRPLLTNLSSLGLSKDYIRYEIVIGDPAYAILSDPVVSFAMVVDIWWSMFYVTFGVLRVSQFQDFTVLINGCLYLSRYVWLAYLGMRTMASVVKWRRWESSFASVDPGLLAILAYIYSGPMVTLLGTTRLVSVYYVLWNIGLPPELYDHGTEAITVSVFITVLMATLPLPYSRLMAWWHHRKTNRIKPFHPRILKNNVSHYTYNDMKALILLSLAMKTFKKQSTGGSLHELYDTNPRYRKVPLYSHRAADCFVLCYKADDSLDQQVRLSLLQCLDLQNGNADLAILVCDASIHCNCVCVINSKRCGTLKMEMKSEQLILHPGDSKCQWVM